MSRRIKRQRRDRTYLERPSPSQAGYGYAAFHQGSGRCYHHPNPELHAGSSRPQVLDNQSMSRNASSPVPSEQMGFSFGLEKKVKFEASY